MSANRIEIRTEGTYNYYIVETADRKITIGGVPEKYSESYIGTAASSDAVILLTANPEFTGGLGTALEANPNLEVYATAAGLRNIKQILNRDINERLIKDEMVLGGIRFFITPNLSWIDSCMALYDGALFSGEAFSGAGAGGLEEEFKRRLFASRAFAFSAAKRLSGEGVERICPAVGSALSDAAGAFRLYRELCRAEKPGKGSAVILYSSRFGYTEALAKRLEERLKGALSVTMAELDALSADEAAALLNSAGVLLVGTDTINRNAPRKLWDAVISLDLMNKKGTPYFVFGSHGWSGDGARLIDRTLEIMGMRRAAKPVDVILKPDEGDLKRIDEAADRILAHIEKYGGEGLSKR